MTKKSSVRDLAGKAKISLYLLNVNLSVAGGAFPTNDTPGALVRIKTGGTVGSTTYAAGDWVVQTGDPVLGEGGWVLMEDASDT